MKKTQPKAREADQPVLKTLGGGLCKGIDDDMFIALLFYLATTGVSRGSVETCQEMLGVEINVPASLLRLHKAKLKYWPVFEIDNIDNMIGDVNHSGAVYHEKLQVGAGINFNDAGGLSFHKEFRFKNGALP